ITFQNSPMEHACPCQRFPDLYQLAEITGGSIASIWLTTNSETCGSGCIVWCLEDHKDSENTYVHMLLVSSSVPTISSRSGRIYRQVPRIYHSVTSQPTQCNHQRIGKMQGVCKHNEPEDSTQLIPWIRTSVNRRFLNEVNQRLRECARECARATANSHWLSWSSVAIPLAKLMKGREVLARRRTDGHFYLGVIHHVQRTPVGDRVLVQFGPFRRAGGTRCGTKDVRVCSDQYQYESIDITDVIDLKHALRHPIALNDKVLVPELWPLPVCASHPSTQCRRMIHARYQPGTVVSGGERRNDEGKGTFTPPPSVMLTAYHLISVVR
ncbi:unnamed protein product, partial [Dicrocoelium dendriticum]